MFFPAESRALDLRIVGMMAVEKRFASLVGLS